MPKFITGIVVVKTFETFASSDEEAKEHIRKWQEGETEASEGGVKVTRYKLGWDEGVDCTNPVPGRDEILAAFLDVMLNKIPGVPREVESGKIITPPGFTMLGAPESLVVNNICKECLTGNYIDGECNHCKGKEPLTT